MDSDAIIPAADGVLPDLTDAAVVDAYDPAALRPLPTWVVAMNLCTIVALFVPIRGHRAPFDDLMRLARMYHGRVIGFAVAEAALSAPFLLALPLVAWSWRLAIRPMTRRLERSVFWAAAFLSMSATFYSIAFAAEYGDQFFLATTVGAAMLLIGALAVCIVRTTHRGTYVPALTAMSAAWAANAVLAILIIVTHTDLGLGGAVVMLVVAAQVVGGLVAMYRSWVDRSAVPLDNRAG